MNYESIIGNNNNVLLYIVFICLVFLIALFTYPFKVRVKFSLIAIRIYLLDMKVYEKKYDAYYAVGASTVKKPPKIIELRSHYLKLMNYLNFTSNHLIIGGFDFDYAVGAMIFGISYGLWQQLQLNLANRQIPFTYDINFTGPFEVGFESIFRLRLGRIIYEGFKIYQSNHEQPTPNQSDTRN